MKFSMCSTECQVTKKSGTKGDADWNELVASIIKNTSMTVRDIEDLSFVELEDLMDGMLKYSEREKRAIKGETVEYNNTEDYAAMLQAGKIDFSGGF